MSCCWRPATRRSFADRTRRARRGLVTSSRLALLRPASLRQNLQAGQRRLLRLDGGQFGFGKTEVVIGHLVLSVPGPATDHRWVLPVERLLGQEVVAEQVRMEVELHAVRAERASILEQNSSVEVPWQADFLPDGQGRLAVVHVAV